MNRTVEALCPFAKQGAGPKKTRGFCYFQTLCLLLILTCHAGCSKPATESPAGNSGETKSTLPDAKGSASVPTPRNDDRANETLTKKQSPQKNSASDFGIRFETAPASSGFAFRRFDDMRGQHRILEVNGGGVGILDIEHDGWPDVFFPNGCSIPVRTDSKGTPGILFRNRFGQTFAEVNQQSGVQQYGLKFGCAVADRDNDGFDDFYLTAYGGNQLWANNGDGTFSEVAASTGVQCGEWGSSAAWADLNRDGNPDLYVANYLKESDENPTLCPDAESPDGLVGCSPAIFAGLPDRLFLSDGQGAYFDVSEAAGLSKLPGKALGVVICNLSGDAAPEIYVANDGEANFLFTVEVVDQPGITVPGVELTDIAVQSNAALNELGYAQAGMGVIAADFDRSGTADLFLTHFYGDTNTLYLNRSSVASCMFEDATRRSALGPPSRSKLGFGTVAADFNQDGWEDIAVANGHVDDRTWMKIPQPFRMTAQLFANDSGHFHEVSESAGEYFRQPRLGRGLAVADLNQDGHDDLVFSNQLDDAVLLYNKSQTKFPVARLKLVGRESPRVAIGTTVTVQSEMRLVRQIVGGGGFQSTSSLEIVIPMETAEQTAEIFWTAGTRQTVTFGEGSFVIVEDQGPARTKN
ncbi:MAG: CRTAC1 family protein [Planctomycetaceae bacterium]|nr:CRTAC1 family protein [Planctomycetaceae bacterium]